MGVPRTRVHGPGVRGRGGVSGRGGWGVPGARARAAGGRWTGGAAGAGGAGAGVTGCLPAPLAFPWAGRGRRGPISAGSAAGRGLKTGPVGVRAVVVCAAVWASTRARPGTVRALRGVPERRPRAGRGAGERLGRALPPAPAAPGAAPRRDLAALGQRRAACADPALPGRGLRRRRGWTLPGTLWGGAGTSAGSASELGTRAGGVRGQAHPILLAGPRSPALPSDLFRGPDRCCRDHDQCSAQITALQLNYGIRNYRLRTVSHFGARCAGGAGTHQVAGGLLTAPDCPAGSGGACRPSTTPSPTSSVLPPSACWRCRALCWRRVRSVFSGTGGEGECPGGPLLRTRGWCIRCCRAGCALPGCPAGCRGAQLGHGRADVRSFMARGVCRCERYGVVLLARMVQQSQYHYSLPVQEQPSCTAPRQGKEVL